MCGAQPWLCSELFENFMEAGNEDFSWFLHYRMACYIFLHGMCYLHILILIASK
jgi:hypothetical protein